MPFSKRAPAEAWLRAGSNRASRLLASIVLLAKISGLKTPERVDAVGVAPTASKVFALDGTAEGIRTPDLLVRSQTLYPAELQPHTTLTAHL